jgi:membrane-associated phospholipid phosphatase
LAASAGLPARDAAFDAFDKSLGFDWMSLFAWFNAHPILFQILRAGYFSMTAQAALIVMCLAFTGRLAWLRVFLLAFLIATIATIAVSAILPAQGAWLRYDLQGIELSSAVVPATKHFLPIFEGLRNGSYRTLVAMGAEGIITFPSLHAALAVILAMAMWPVSGLRWLGVGVNLVMLAATPIDGLHYLADVVAGLAIAGVSLLAGYAIAWPENRPETKRLRTEAGAFRNRSRIGELLAASSAELGRDARERPDQLSAHRIHDCDNRNRDASGDEAVFDGRRARLVLRKLNKRLHELLLRSTRGCLSSVAPQPLLPGRCGPWAKIPASYCATVNSLDECQSLSAYSACG